jgi:hypothetical protein
MQQYVPKFTNNNLGPPSRGSPTNTFGPLRSNQQDGMVANGANNRPRTETNSTVQVHRQTITSLSSSYCFGEEGKKALETQFAYLAKQEGKLRFQDWQPHPHPVGATMRAAFDDLVKFGYLAGQKIHDIGGSKTRVMSRFDPEGTKMTDRVHTTTPVLSVRDIHRERTNPEEVPNNCQCIGGQWANRCAECCALAPYWKSAMSVDSIYYPGVMEELMGVLRVSKRAGYVVFNDYHHAYLKNGKSGRACDAESTYTISGSTVTSTVKGNVSPYKHGVLKTGGGYSWQYLIKHPSPSMQGAEYWMIFETLHEFWNHDIPYKLCRVVCIAENELVNRGFAPRTGMPDCQTYGLNDSIWFDVDEDKARDTEERYRKEMALYLSKYEDPKPDTKSPPEISTWQMRIEECKHKNTPEAAQMVIDLNRRIETYRSMYATWDAVVREWNSRVHKTNERFYTTHEADETWATCEISTSAWYTLGFSLNRTLYKAPLQMVYDAFVRIGQKETIQAIDQAATTALRDYIKERDLGHWSNQVQEAFIIARVMRAQQIRRLQTAMMTSSSVSSLTKKL